MARELLVIALVAACGCGGCKKSESAPTGTPLAGKAFYRIDASPPAACASGSMCEARVVLTALGDYHVNKDYPFKFIGDPAVNAEAVKKWSLPHPILRDETGTVGKAYGATNTPNMFVVDKTGKVVYAGAIDNSPDGEGKSPRGGKLVNYVDAALDDIAAGREVQTAVTRPYGCSVKYGS